ncbi:DUF5958 family protein [Streptomyces murinus]|uniref:DUF5958 family protein n=1 Tax=Streptomyces murinus TaxID=33900 RepID=UPI003555DA4C
MNSALPLARRANTSRRTGPRPARVVPRTAADHSSQRRGSSRWQRASDGSKGARSGVRPTHTVALLGVADTRRRELYCAGGCAHAWHNLPGGRGAAS